MALLDQLQADAALVSGQMDRIVYRGRVGSHTLRVAVAQDGRATMRLHTSAEAVLRFGTRAQLPYATLRTGDAEFDAAIGMLGDPTGLIRVGVEARRLIAAWLSEPGRWVTDNEVGAQDVAPDALEAVVAQGRAVIASLAPPSVAELLGMSLSAPEPLASLIDLRLRARLPNAPDPGSVLKALQAHASAPRLRWLQAMGPAIEDQPAGVLALLPDPAPPEFDQYLPRWAKDHPAARARLKAVAAIPRRRRALLKSLAGDAAGLRAVCVQMPDDGSAVADIEAVVPTTIAARLARIEALVDRPPGDPRAWRHDIRIPDGRVRAAVSRAVQRMLPTWLEDPQTAAVALGELGLAASNSALLIEMVERDGAPALVALLARTSLARPEDEQRRLEVLSRASTVPPFDLSEARAALEPGLRAAAEGVLVKHLPAWLTDPSAADALLSIGALDAALTDKVLTVCRARPCPGAVRLLASFEFRAEKDRVAQAEALGLTGARAAESPLLGLMGSGYAVRLACIEGLANVGGKASLKVLQGIASGFFVEKALKETALRSIAQIEARLGGGAGALSMATADGRLSVSED